MSNEPYAVASCFEMSRRNALRVDYLKFDELYKSFNLEVRPDGWIKWFYSTDVLENYLLNFQVAMLALKGGASVFLHFYLVEYEPSTNVLAGGTPTEFVRIESVPLSHRSIFHTAGLAQVQGGLVYNLSMKLEPQDNIMPPIYTQRTRWFRVFISYEPPASCTGNDATLSGFGVPVLDFQEGLLTTSTYITERLPFVSMEAVRLASPLTVSDLAALQIPSRGDVANAKQEAIQESHNNLLLDLANKESDVSVAVLNLVENEGTSLSVDEVRTALITDLGNDTSEFSVAILDLVNSPSTQDFTVSPTSGNVSVGSNITFEVTLAGGLQESTLTVASSNSNTARAIVTGTTITVTGVAEGSATITVSSTSIAKTQELGITIIDTPSEATFKATNVVNILVPTKMWVSLDTLTKELTLADPNGSNIILAGWVVSVDSLAKTSVIRYLKASPSNYQVSSDTATYLPSTGDAFNLKNGIAVSPGTGYEVPDCTVASSGYGGVVFVKVAVTASDIATLEQHKIS